MAVSECFGPICLIPLVQADRYFGFAEFLAGLALMVLAWTNADIRYKFRIETAPIPLRIATYIVVAAVGILTLLTDMWRVAKWRVPAGPILTPATWQAVMGGALLLMFLLWVWYAFIAPAKFGKANAKRYYEALYHVVLRASPTELPEIADELRRSIPRIFALARPNLTEAERNGVNGIAHSVLYLLADRRMVQHIVRSSPGTIYDIVEEAKKQPLANIKALSTLLKNVTASAIADKNSFVYYETHGSETGFMGYLKPITRSLYGSYHFVNAVESLDVHYKERDSWDAEQWEAFFRLVLIMIEDMVKSGHVNQSSGLTHRLLDHTFMPLHDLTKLVGNDEYWRSNAFDKLTAVMHFCNEIILLLDGQEERSFYAKFDRTGKAHVRHDIYDAVAHVLFECISAVARIKSPRDLCWTLQHNAVWSQIFEFYRPDGKAARIVKLKLKLLVYGEIKSLRRLPSFRGAAILGMLLNISGLNPQQPKEEHKGWPLGKMAVRWMVDHYARYAVEHPPVADYCLVEGITYDASSFQVSYTRTPSFGGQPRVQTLSVNPYPAVVATHEVAA